MIFSTNNKEKILNGTWLQEFSFDTSRSHHIQIQIHESRLST